MNIIKEKEGGRLKLTVEGRLDTTTAPELEEVIKAEFGDADHVAFDFKSLEYVSSAGLRVLLLAQKTVNAKNAVMEINNVNDSVMDVFDITGFSDILTINK